MPKKPTVFIVDDDASVRRSLERLMRCAGYDVETYEDAQSFLRQHCHESPGCLVLDVKMPGADGLALQEKLSHRDEALPIIFITGHGDIPMSVKAMKRGAFDFLTKPFDDKALLTAVKGAIEKDAREACVHAERRALRCRYETLSAREREVFLHLLTGRLNKQIAADLGIKEKTVKVHRSRILRKFKAGSIAQLVRIAIRMGMDLPTEYDSLK